jgi:UDP-glucose 4-epimerase
MNVEGKIEIKNIGTRHGEKLFESLLGTEERTRAIDRGQYFQVPLDTRSLDYQIYFNKGQEDISERESYTSHNTEQLNVDEVVTLIKNLPEFQQYAKAHL